MTCYNIKGYASLTLGAFDKDPASSESFSYTHFFEHTTYEAYYQDLLHFDVTKRNAVLGSHWILLLRIVVSLLLLWRYLLLVSP
jgi:hypothetical protein